MIPNFPSLQRRHGADPLAMMNYLNLMSTIIVVTTAMITLSSNDYQPSFIFVYSFTLLPTQKNHFARICGLSSLKDREPLNALVLPLNDGCRRKPFTSPLFSTRTETTTKLWYTNNNDDENNPSILKTSKNFNNTFSIPSGQDYRYDGDKYEGATEYQTQYYQLEEVEEMPWSTSVSPSYSNHNKTLPFMPYYTFTKNEIFSRLHNVQLYDDNNTRNTSPKATKPESSSEKYYYHQKQDKSRIINESYQSDEYRKIRLTYYDGGNQIQVFNSLWYPQPHLGNIPLLGIDLICFNGAKCLVVVDFQPLTCLVDNNAVEPKGFSCELEQGGNDQLSGTTKWESSHLATLWHDLPTALKGKMSKRFYDEHQFFSEYMIFGRFDISKKKNITSRDDTIHENIIYQGGELWDAFVNYLSYHIDYVQEQYVNKHENDDNMNEPSSNIANDSLFLENFIKEGQRQYDEYSAERDPAKPMFNKMFGEEWGNGYVHDFLFDLSSNSEKEI